MKSKLLEIINHYGIDNQQRKLQEEVFELQQAITIYDTDEWDISEMREHIEEEVADVCVLLMQFCNYYKLNVGNIGQIIDKKIDRQLERIKNETDNTMVE
jgi:NTP pyrophosphatase (non-canonical NTP hydrolase)